MLRFRSPVSSTIRTASHDDIVPLSKPITLKNGKQTDVIHIQKGTTIFIPVTAHNFDREIFGADADDFRQVPLVLA